MCSPVNTVSHISHFKKSTPGPGAGDKTPLPAGEPPIGEWGGSKLAPGKEEEVVLSLLSVYIGLHKRAWWLYLSLPVIDLFSTSKDGPYDMSPVCSVQWPWSWKPTTVEQR